MFVCVCFQTSTARQTGLSSTPLACSLGEKLIFSAYSVPFASRFVVCFASALTFCLCLLTVLRSDFDSFAHHPFSSQYPRPYQIKRDQRGRCQESGHLTNSKQGKSLLGSLRYPSLAVLFHLFVLRRDLSTQQLSSAFSAPCNARFWSVSPSLHLLHAHCDPHHNVLTA